MISYQTFCAIKAGQARGLKIPQIARELSLDQRTVADWIDAEAYRPRKASERVSKLDPYKWQIRRMLEQHPYSAMQIFQRLKEDGGYTGGYSILKDYVRLMRPVRKPAFLTLHFEPGEAAQVDWGNYGAVNVGATRRRLSFFVMVLCHSRMMYLEFTLAQTLEHFLACHQRAFEFFGGVPGKVMIDNLKTAVLKRPHGGEPIFHPKYLDFANHYGFKIAACNVRRGNEKGRVENGVGYVKKNFLNGLDISDFSMLNPAAQEWLHTIANVRIHGETRQKPQEMFAEEQSRLQPLSLNPYDIGTLRPVCSTNRFRVALDTNRYSVPAEYAGVKLQLKIYPDRLYIYHRDQLIAQHARSYDRHQDFENPDHVRELLQRRKKAGEQKLLKRFLQLSPRAADYHQQLAQRRFNTRGHIRKIVALSEIYGAAKVGRALEDGLFYQAFSSEYITNILEQRERQLPEAGALHLTHKADLLELEVPTPDLKIYEQQGGAYDE